MASAILVRFLLIVKPQVMSFWPIIFHLLSFMPIEIKDDMYTVSQACELSLLDLVFAQISNSLVLLCYLKS